jgi:large subunit ribosomal protein L15e
MGAYKYIQETLQKEYKARDSVYREKVRGWRHGPVMEKVEHPANITRARRLGYKAKQGYSVVRIRIDKGRRRRQTPMGGRKPRHNYVYVQPQLSHQAIAEQRVNRIYKNMEVLNSYWVGEDGNNKYFEVILADPMRKGVDPKVVARKGRAFRGLTSSGRKARGLGRGRQKHSS